MWSLTLLLLAGLLSCIHAQIQACTSPTSLCDCSEDLSKQEKVISCRYKNLNQVPTFTQTNIVYQRIEFTSVEETGECPPIQPCNDITQLPADAFQNLLVKEIDLRNNAIVSFNVNAFRGLENTLEKLYIEGDGVIAPPYSSLTSLQVLQSLHLENFNQLEFNAGNTQLSFPNLKEFTINNFKTLQRMFAAAFTNINTVESLRLQRLPQLGILPVLAIQSFTELTHLEIYETNVTQILGESFKVLTKLTNLEIKSNGPLTTIATNAFDVVSNTITFLTLFQNNLNNFNFLSSTTWPQLTQLDISYNVAQIGSGTFSTIPNLNYLTMADMTLQSINSGMFTGLTNLHTLDLGFNSITNIPSDVFQNCPNLVDLRLNNQNEIDANAQLTFDDSSFTSIESSLQHLLIEGNRFNENQFWNTVSKFVNLIELNAAGTSLTNIPDYAFRYNTKLEKVDFSSNSITNLKQETFFGPRNTLNSISLYGNQIQTVDKCVLSQFPTQPEIFLTSNPLHCDCQLIWLYNWSQTDSSLAFTHIGQCSTPQNLANQYFSDFSVTDLVCPPSYVEPTCADLYTTTTSTTSTTTTTPTTTTTTQIITQRPLPDFSITIVSIQATSITVTWAVNDKTYLTEYKLEIIKDGQKTIQLINKEETELKLENLTPSKFYQFCLILEIENEFRENNPQCASGTTLMEVTEPPIVTTAEPESQVNIPVIVGSVVGGVILVALIIIIIFFILKSNKPKKRSPMAEPMSWRAEMPQAGGTAKRHAKKPDKEGASPDDISINVISSGTMNSDRMSAGSYQYLNEKDSRAINTKPMPTTVSNGHYVNNIETRPLPRMPYGGGGRNNPGYVNDAFHSGATNFPETSLNQYSEVVN